MDSCDVLIVGGGPAGSSCAWKLARGGLDTIVLDKSCFPRHKVCGGWITPAVLSELDIEPDSMVWDAPLANHRLPHQQHGRSRG